MCESMNESVSFMCEHETQKDLRNKILGYGEYGAYLLVNVIGSEY